MCPVLSTPVAGACACATSLGAHHGPCKFAKWGKKGVKNTFFAKTEFFPIRAQIFGRWNGWSFRMSIWWTGWCSGRSTVLGSKSFFSVRWGCNNANSAEAILGWGDHSARQVPPDGFLPLCPVFAQGFVQKCDGFSGFSPIKTELSPDT